MAVELQLFLINKLIFTMLQKKKFKYLVIIAIALAIGLALLLSHMILEQYQSSNSVWPLFSLTETLQMIRNSGHWGVLVSLGLMIIHSVIPFPSEFVAIANGMIYGLFWGVVITWSGAIMGASISFALAKRFGRPFINRFLAKQQQEKLDNWTKHYSTGALLFSRFIPIIAFNLINYAAGLANVTWWKFLWTTGCGILPLTTLMVVAGDQIQTLSINWFIFILTIGLVCWYIIHHWTHYHKTRPPGR